MTQIIETQADGRGQKLFSAGLALITAGMFVSQAIPAAQLPVNLGTAGNFAILAKSGISTVPTSAITGDIGVSPIASTGITGFSLSLPAGGAFATSPQVTGKVYAPDYAAPTPATLTTAVTDMQTAYTDAAGRSTPSFTDLGAGQIGGLTLAPGLYKWGTGVLISKDVTLRGSADSVWIFQIAGNLTEASGKHIILAGGALAQNVFWQCAGSVTIGTTAQFAGIILSQTSVNLGTYASVSGRLLAQTAVTLNANAITVPSAPTGSTANQLVVIINGNGVVSPNYNGQALQLGHSFKMTATPGKGWLFTGWTGSGSTPASTLNFVMQDNLLFQANFASNILPAAQGRYTGLFAVTNSPRQETNSGLFHLTIAGGGGFSGELILGSETVPLSGKFDLSGAAQVNSPRHNQNLLTTILQLDVANQMVDGTVSDGSFVATLTGDQAVFNAGNKATDYAGRYTLVFPGTTNLAAGPFGVGYGMTTVDDSGNIIFSGSLADGTPIAQSSTVSKGGFWPFYLVRYGGKGSIWGWNYFTNGSLISETFASWINPTNSIKVAADRSGFTNQQLTTVGGRYLSAGWPPAGLTNWEVILQGAALDTALSNQITLKANGAIANDETSDNVEKLNLTINKTSGFVSGTFVNPANHKETITIHGVILQTQTNAQGYFIESNQSGQFLMQP